MPNKNRKYYFNTFNAKDEAVCFHGTPSAYAQYLENVARVKNGLAWEITPPIGRPARKLPPHLMPFDLLIFREKYGLTVAQLARALKVTRTTIRNWQSKHYIMPADVVEKLVSWEKAHPVPAVTPPAQKE